MNQSRNHHQIMKRFFHEKSNNMLLSWILNSTEIELGNSVCIPSLLLKFGMIWKSDSHKILFLEYSKSEGILLLYSKVVGFLLILPIWVAMGWTFLIGRPINLCMRGNEENRGANAKKEGKAISYGFKIVLLLLLLVRSYSCNPFLLLQEFIQWFSKNRNNESWLFQKKSWWRIIRKTTLGTILKQAKGKVALQSL